MGGNYFELNDTKRLLNIDISDTVDDELLTQFGEQSNLHIDNILKQHDERIPLKEPGVMADVKQAANYFVASLFRGKRGDADTAKYWKEMFTETINGVIMERSIDALSYDVQRFPQRFTENDDEFRLWM